MEDIFNIAATLLSLGISMLLAHFILRHGSFAYLSERSDRNTTLDGVRGFLAIAVFFHHFIITWHWKNSGIWDRPPEDYYLNYGKVGVAIFFMITGFLFVSKILRDKGQTNWSKLYESRIFRIFPLYVFALLIITIVVGFASNFDLNVSPIKLLKEYIRWGIFHGETINAYPDTSKIIAGVDWTLKYEWVFYLCLPALAYVTKLGRAWVSALVLLSILLFFLPVKLATISTSFFIQFAVGGCAAFIFANYDHLKPLAQGKLASTFSVLLMLATIFHPDTLSPSHLLLISTFFILVVLGNDMFGLFSLKPAILLGEISYSIYLLHGAVLYLFFSVFDICDITQISRSNYLLLMPVLCALVVLLSTFTFVFIEKPCISMGRKYRLTRMLTAAINHTKKASSRISD